MFSIFSSYFNQSSTCRGSRELAKVGGLWLINSWCLSRGGSGGGGGDNGTCCGCPHHLLTHLFSLLAHLLAFLPHLCMHICHSISHLLHYPHLGCNCWINSGWWRIWRIRRIHLGLLLLLSKYPVVEWIGG
jgi:hypothetical protein